MELLAMDDGLQLHKTLSSFRGIAGFFGDEPGICFAWITQEQIPGSAAIELQRPRNDEKENYAASEMTDSVHPFAQRRGA